MFQKRANDSSEESQAAFAQFYSSVLLKISAKMGKMGVLLALFLVRNFLRGFWWPRIDSALRIRVCTAVMLMIKSSQLH